MGRKMLKILFAGLQNSGKTSIILTLQKKYSQMTGIKPTRGVERTGLDNLGLDIKVWDLGGQEEFREKYFEKKEEYFTETDIMFYVIDVLDSRKFYESLTYYLKIIDIFKTYSEKLPQIIIFIHKFDPDLQDDEKILQNIEKVQVLFNQDSLETTFFNTSIYNEWTVIQGFSSGLTSLSKDEIALETKLKEFAQETDSSFVLLVDKNRMLIGNYKKDEMSKILGDRLLPMIDIYSDISNLSVYQLNNLIAQLSDMYLFLQKIQVKSAPYYLMIISHSKDIGLLLEKKLPTFVKQLEATIEQFLLTFQDL